MNNSKFDGVIDYLLNYFIKKRGVLPVHLLYASWKAMIYLQINQKNQNLALFVLNTYTKMCITKPPRILRNYRLTSKKTPWTNNITYDHYQCPSLG